eukprot:gnl/TRDRNA2_/TRDRNA2_92577_c1_seq1.p1 gnl/TRDRNA2_/TRDRNA2_92577_c1~~gnl/TRDRNA2_/TRDRNA2_92577_c1_seq1.p1  ORF type:complete len:172 (+),score=34.72 gnl/TRDRNA2_/TRDRNA2_92577_c1_seq1:75-518(+)
MHAVIPEFVAALARVDAAAARLVSSSELRLLWKAQFVWGFHGLAMAAECVGCYREAAEAFRTCIQLIAAVAPSTGYELKYRMMLVQCLARQVLSGAPGGSGRALRSAVREAEVGHARCYGGGTGHFRVRMKDRLEEVEAAIRRAKES